MAWDSRPDTGGVAYIGCCPVCGKHCYETKRDAKRAARRLHPGSRLNPYRCGRWWHIGHLPAPVVAGVLPRDRIRRPKGAGQ
jgi:hypothetical protein